MCALQTSKCNKEDSNHVGSINLKLPEDGLSHQSHLGVMLVLLDD